MSVSVDLLCGVLDHDSSALYSTWDLDIYVEEKSKVLKPDVRTVNDLVAAVDKAHAYWCRCGVRLGPAVWRVDLPIGQDPNTALAWYVPREDQLLDGTTPATHLSELPRDTIHLILGTNVPSVGQDWCITRGLRRLGGDVCRVAGSSERILPDACNFRDIVHTPGCYYIERFDWIMDTFGGDLSTHMRIPILRRPPGFGKTTFLSSFASYFEGSLDERLFPNLRAWDQNVARPLLVFHLDFAQLQFSDAMSNEDLNAECLRFMYAAAESFYEKYSPSLGARAPQFDPDDTPYGNVKRLARGVGRKVFLAIDNYTAPFVPLQTIYQRKSDTFFYRIETSMGMFIIAYILLGIGTGLFPRGLITGTTLPDDGAGAVLPFDDGGLFSQDTNDMTHAVSCAHIIAFTRSDIEELVRSYLGVAENSVHEIASRLVPKVYKQQIDPDTEKAVEVEMTYAPRVVLETLKAAAAAAAAAGQDADWDEGLHLPASNTTSSFGSNSSDIAHLLRTPVDLSDTGKFNSK